MNNNEKYFDRSMLILILIVDLLHIVIATLVYQKDPITVTAHVKSHIMIWLKSLQMSIFYVAVVILLFKPVINLMDGNKQAAKNSVAWLFFTISIGMMATLAYLGRHCPVRLLFD